MSCDGTQLAECIVITVGVESGPNGHPVPSIDRQGVYPTCFEKGTWFAWKLERETGDSNAKPRKIPRAPWEYPDHPERYVGHDDPEVWADLDTACEWVEKLPTYGLANRVPDADERRVAFSDFDDARDPETGEIHPKAWDISQTHDLPAWLSSSRTGLHAFAVVKETPADYRQNTETELPEWEHTDAPELELYTNAHFCALTGEHVEGTPLDAPDLIETVGGMLREHGEEKQPDGDAFDPDAEPDLTRDENAAKSRKAVVSAAVLKGRKDRCPVAHGDHDPVDDDADDEREPVDRQHDLGLADEIARRDLLDIDREAAVEHVEQAGTTDAEGNTPDANEPGDSVAERARDAFVVTVDYFHEQLDRELPESVDFDTPREYFTEGRGWDHETVTEHRLGYAPADKTALLDRLMREGFDRDAILGTGLFYESLDPHFRGRYVIPYVDRDGRPCYAISRSIDEDDDGHPNDPKGDQKYTKAIKTKDYSHVDEPIFGLDSVDDDTDRLLIAGGIADAIALQAAGYACISPVTTVRFKHKHEETVVELAEDHDIGRVYIINDAERPSISAKADVDDAGTIADALTIEPFGEGLRGAFANADFLLDAGIETRLVTLPGGDDDLDKVDPDDFIQDDWGSIETLLAAAKPAGEHWGYQAWDDRRQEREISNATREITHHRNEGSTGANKSRLFTLGFETVSGLNEGFRGKNPLGHHGNSEDYFTVYTPERATVVVGYDHKYRKAYNALTYLLCEAGERRADAPNGEISDTEMLALWRHAKDEGHIPDGDPVPHHAQRAIALEHDLCDTGEIEDGWRLPIATYNATLEIIRGELGYDPGRDPLDEARETGGANRWCEECEPPLSADADPIDVDAQREAMIETLYDEFIDRVGLSAWRFLPGIGKTTCAALAAVQRDRTHVIFLPKHENCREFQRDPNKPDGYFHLKGAAQPIGDECMDADIDDDADECPTHGHGSNCPKMCPIYNTIDPEDPLRILFDVLAGVVGVQKAHTILGLHEKGWHGSKCEWQQQWSRIDDEDRIVTVHQYATMESIREHGDIIIDDLQGGLIEESDVSLARLGRQRDAMAKFASLAADARTDAALQKLANFIGDLIDTLSESDPEQASLDDVPVPEFNICYEETFGSRGEIPETVPEETITERTEKRYVGEGGQYIDAIVYEAPVPNPAEALAQAKRMYIDTLLERVRRGEWSDTPIDIDAVFAAITTAGDDEIADACRIAAGTAPILETCPRCDGNLAPENGALRCTERGCGWSEADDPLTDEDSRPGRIDATVNASDTGVHGITIRSHPHHRDLPTTSNTLVLDATLRPAEIAAVFDTTPDTVTTDGDDAYALPDVTATQIIDGAYHRRTFIQSETAQERAQRAIDQTNEMHDDVVYVVLPKARGLFEWPDDAEVLDYYALRGLDRPDADAIVCVGAPHPDEDDLRADARVLGGANPQIRVGGTEYSTRQTDDSEDPVYRKYNYADDAGRGRAIASKTYSGLTGDLFDARHADEIEQAAHRIRPILATQETPKHVYLLTNVATNLPVDRLTTYDAFLNPLEHDVDVPDTALDLLDAVLDAADDPELAIDYADDADGAYSIRATGSEFEDAAAAAGMDISKMTVNRARGDLRDAGLLEEGGYVQRRGVTYTLTELGARVASGR